MVESRAQRAYRSPSIEEAIVEFQFARDEPWDASLSGKLHQHPLIAPHYRATPRKQRFKHFQFKVTEPQEQADVTETARIQLLTEDGTRVIMVGDGVIGISTLPPYDGWAAVRQRVEAVLNALAELSPGGVLPRIVRIGTRYINRIMIPGGDPLAGSSGIDVERYFNCGPRKVAGLPAAMPSFLCRTSGQYEDGARLTSTFLPYPEQNKAGRIAYLLDIDVAQLPGAEAAMTIGEVMARVDVLHGHVLGVFEASITDATREVLDAT